MPPKKRTRASQSALDIDSDNPSEMSQSESAETIRGLMEALKTREEAVGKREKAVGKREDAASNREEDVGQREAAVREREDVVQDRENMLDAEIKDPKPAEPLESGGSIGIVEAAIHAAVSQKKTAAATQDEAENALTRIVETLVKTFRALEQEEDTEEDAVEPLFGAMNLALEAGPFKDDNKIMRQALKWRVFIPRHYDPMVNDAALGHAHPHWEKLVRHLNHDWEDLRQCHNRMWPPVYDRRAAYDCVENLMVFRRKQDKDALLNYLRYQFISDTPFCITHILRGGLYDYDPDTGRRVWVKSKEPECCCDIEHLKATKGFCLTIYGHINDNIRLLFEPSSRLPIPLVDWKELPEK